MMKRKIIYTLLTTLCIIILLNVWAARQARKRHLLSSIPTALIDGYVSEMKEGFDTWFIGNSTLDNGVVIKRIIKGTNRTILKTPLGSASAEAMCLLAASGLSKTTKRPTEIYLFITKDDLNAKGLRGETSVSYINALSGAAFREQFLSAIPLYSYRISLRKKYEKDITAFIKGEERNKNENEVKDTVKAKDEPINETHSSHLINLGKDFTLNLGGFKQLAKVCKQKGIKLHVIFPPVTKSVPNWQNYYYPKMSYHMVMDNVKKELKNNAVGYTDYTDSIPSTTYYFKDEYHLSKKGAIKFTDILISKMNNERGN